MNDDNRGLVIFLLIIAWLVLGDGGGVIGPVTPSETTLAIIYESSDTTPELANLLVMLRNGAAAETLKTRKCELVAVDKDVTDHTNKPLKVIELAGQVTVPEMILYDRPATKVIKRQPCATTVDAVLEFAK